MTNTKRFLVHARVCGRSSDDGWQEDLAQVDAVDREAAKEPARKIFERRWGRKATIVIKHVEAEEV